MISKDYLKIDPRDNVAIALRETETIPIGHKIALKTIKNGMEVIKYGYPIGIATQNIAEGQIVHSHNLRTNLVIKQDYVYRPKHILLPEMSGSSKTFNGYLRSDGRVGVRNEIWVVPTVGCCNNVVEKLCHQATNFFKGRRIDGIFPFSHPYGCSQLGDDLITTQKFLGGLAQHPNAGGVCIVGLGCENNNIQVFKEKLAANSDDRRIKFLNLQDVEKEEFQVGLSLLEELINYAEQFERQSLPISKLVLGLKCGSSDAFSGITANPLVGELSDYINSLGGSAILTEVPEMFGAETILMDRAINKDVFKKIVFLINRFKKYFIKYGQPIHDNPSPGNVTGGITTLEEKSLGCIYKGGKASIVDVLEYGQLLSVNGLNLLNGPGNDIVAITNLIVSGAQIILFTTGRGTPLGGPVPTIKISSNTELADKKEHWIDFDAGRLLQGRSLQELTDELLNYVIKVASGEVLTKNEKNNYRQIAIFKDGVIL